MENEQSEIYSTITLPDAIELTITSYCTGGGTCAKATIGFMPSAVKSQHWTDAFTLYFDAT